MAQFLYSGPQTSINIPPEQPGGDLVSILLIPSAEVELPARALALHQVQRYQRKGWLTAIDAPKPKRGRKPASTNTTTEGDSE